MRCHRCSGNLGRIRHQLLTFSGYLRFCSKKCLNAYKSESRKKAAKQRFLGWLSGQS
jgi:hypothetical protein